MTLILTPIANFLKANKYCPLALGYCLTFFVIGQDLLSFESSIKLDVWFELHEIFYLSAALCGILAVTRADPLWSSLIGLVLGYALSLWDIMDDLIHPWLGENLFDYHQFASNPQYSKLLLFIISLVAILLSFFRKKQSIAPFFTLLLVGVNLLLVYNNHLSYPDGILRELINDRRKDLANFASMEHQDIPTACKHLKLNCRIRRENEIISYPFAEPLSREMSTHYEKLTHNIFKNHNQFILETNKSPSMYLTMLNRESIVEVFDPNKIKFYWEVSAFHFYRNSSLVSCGWFLFYLAILYVHRKIKYDLKSFFKKTFALNRRISLPDSHL